MQIDEDDDPLDISFKHHSQITPDSDLQIRYNNMHDHTPNQDKQSNDVIASPAQSNKKGFDQNHLSKTVK